MHLYSIALVVLLAGCGLAARIHLYQGRPVPIAATSSGYETQSRLNAAESAENARSQESANKGYSKYASGYPVYGYYGGGAYAESGYDQRAKSDASSKASRSLNKEDSASGYNQVAYPHIYGWA